MKFSIRQVTPGDASAIAKLSQQLGYPLDTKQALQNIKAIAANGDADAFVAIDENNIAGWICVAFAVQIESAPYCELRGLVVDERYRRKGIGKTLIEKAKQWSKEKGTNKLRLRCNVKRSEAHVFYEYLGFTHVKQQTVFEIAVL
jgi:GNAT superfamily N-acetyltransferase